METNKLNSLADLSQIKLKPPSANGHSQYTELFKKQVKYLFKKEHKSIREISDQYKVPFSTLHGWVFPKRKRKSYTRKIATPIITQEKKTSTIIEISNKEDRARVVLLLVENEIKFNLK